MCENVLTAKHFMFTVTIWKLTRRYFHSLVWVFGIHVCGHLWSRNVSSQAHVSSGSRYQSGLISIFLIIIPVRQNEMLCHLTCLTHMYLLSGISQTRTIWIFQIFSASLLSMMLRLTN